MKLKHTEDIVAKVLLQRPETRSDDWLLIYYVYCEINVYVVVCRSFADVMKNHKDFGFPSFESITRARRKIFEKNPHINPKVIKQKRSEMETQFREYAIHGKGELTNGDQ